MRQQLAEVLPDDTSETNVFGWEQRLERTAQSLRDVVYAMLLDGGQLGARYGRDQVEQLLGVNQKAVGDTAGDTTPSVTISLTDWDLVNSDAADWARAHAGDLVAQLNETTAAVLRPAIAEYISNTLTLRDLLDELEPLFGKVRAKRIAITETTAAYAQGNISAWKRAGVITMYEWRTARDEHVCPRCGPLDGQQFALDDGTAPPAHVNCRCWIVPVVGTP